MTSEEELEKLRKLKADIAEAQGKLEADIQKLENIKKSLEPKDSKPEDKKPVTDQVVELAKKVKIEKFLKMGEFLAGMGLFLTAGGILILLGQMFLGFPDFPWITFASAGIILLLMGMALSALVEGTRHQAPEEPKHKRKRKS